jgi:hypothetical protein
MIAATIYEGTHDVHRRRNRLCIARGGSRIQAQQVGASRDAVLQGAAGVTALGTEKGKVGRRVSHSAFHQRFFKKKKFLTGELSPSVL